MNNKLNIHMINIINDYLLPDENKMKLNKLKMVKSIDFECEYFDNGFRQQIESFKQYYERVVKKI